jgi:hypothetical protein
MPSRAADLACSCGALAWEGRDRATVGRLRDGRVVVDALPEWQPGGTWTCMYCDVPAKSPTLRLGSTHSSRGG